MARAAASPTAVVLAGAGIAVGEAAHLGLVVALGFGALAYGGRLVWAAGRRAIFRRQRGQGRPPRVDPWSVPEPWRAYVSRALDARKAFRQLSRDCQPGAVSDYLVVNLPKVEQAVQDQWALARSGAALGPAQGEAQKVARELTEAEAALDGAAGADRRPLAAREASLAAHLRSLRQREAVSADISARLSAAVSQLESLVAMAGELVGTAGAPGAPLATLQSEMAALVKGLEEAKGVVRGPGQEP